MIEKKKCFLCALSVLFFILCGCSSSDVFSIPGEKAIVQKNIASEYMSIAKAYEELKKYTKAIEYYQKALDIDRDGVLSNSALYNIGYCYAMSGDWQNAKSFYKSLLEKDADNTNLKISLAYIDAMSGNLEEACLEYAAICSENPTNASLLKNYISVLLAAKKNEEAENQLQVLIKNFPEDSSIKEIQKAILDSGKITSDEEPSGKEKK